MFQFLLISFSFFIFTKSYAELKVKVHFSPVANFIHQMNCVSGAYFYCSQEAYTRLWQKEFLKEPADQQVLNSWRELMESYDKYIEMEKRSPLLGAERSNDISLENKLRIASFQSENLDQYFRLLDLMIAPDDKSKFISLLRHFYPAFEVWWKKVALSKGTSFAAETEKLVNSEKITQRIRQFAHFYHADLSEGTDLSLSLFYRPQDDGATIGQQLENYSLTEFRENEKPSERIDVVIHELCHFLYKISPAEDFKGLVESFRALQSYESVGAYKLLNETIATALGNGIIARSFVDEKKWKEILAKEESFYNDFYIDTAAKGILPWIEKELEQGHTIYDRGFTEKYVSILIGKLGTQLGAPKLMLDRQVLIVDRKVAKTLYQKINRRHRFSSMDVSESALTEKKTFEDYRLKPELSSLIFVHPANLKDLKKQKILTNSQISSMQKVIKSQKKALYTLKRTSQSFTYVIAASQVEEALEVLEKLMKSKQSTEGLLDLSQP